MPDQNDITFSQYTIDWSALLRSVIEFFGGSGVTADMIVMFLDTAWGVFVLVSLLLAALFFVGYVYAAIRYNQVAEIETEYLLEQERLWQELHGARINSRFEDIKAHIASDNPNDWKLAIIEANIELERMLEAAGYPGTTISEKLKNANPETFTTLQDAWEAHKIRNRIAHEGADFVLTKRQAQETIARYQKVFNEFGHQ